MATNKSALDVRVTGRDDLTPQLDRIESRLIRFVGAIGAGIAAIRITTAPIASAANFQRELANVQKTTNFTNKEIERLGRGLLTLSTRIDVSAVDLAKIAAAAGQQGLGGQGVDGILQFTESVSRMASVLDITAEQAAEDVGKIANIFKIPLSGIEKAVSQFNEVSNNSTAKGEELLDVVKRIGDAAGTLNLGQSIAIAATGLDFGQSPEVVGTSFAKIFSSLVQKQSDFTRLLDANLGKSAEGWATRLKENGLEAFKEVLEGLRKLEPAAQQNTIIKLFGGGRIGALVNKLVQDTSNAVLDKNFRANQTGELGTSALREQATVLNTLKAQATLTLNSLTKAGIEAANKLLPPLTKYAIELQAAFQSDGFQSFLNAVGTAAEVTLRVVVGLAKGIASLNINWENLVPIVTGILGLKLAQSLAGWSAGLLGLGKSLKSISDDASLAQKGLKGAASAAASTAATVEASANKTKAAWLAEKLGYKDVYAEIVRNRQAKLDSARADEELQRRQDDLTKRRLASQRASDATRDTYSAVVDRSAAVSSARQRVSNAQQAAAAQELAIQRSRTERVTAAEVEHQNRMASIEQSYQARRAAIRATGTETGLKALRAEKAAQIAEEASRHERSLRGINQYWSRRAAVAAAGAKAAVDAERLAYLSTVQNFDVAATSVGRRQAALGRAVEAEKEAEQQLKAAKAMGVVNATAATQTAQVGLLGRAWSALTLAGRAASGVLSTLGAALGVIGRVLLGAFGWISLLYVLADMFGVLDKLAPAWRAFTDAVGLSSEASRQADVEAERRKRSLQEEKERVDEVTKAYREAKREGLGQLDETNVKGTVAAIQLSDSASVRDESLAKIASLAAGAKSIIDNEVSSASSAIDIRVANLAEATKNAEAKIAEAQARAESVLSKYAKGTKEYEEAQRNANTQVEGAVRVYAELSRQLDTARENQTKLSAEFRTAQRDFDLLGSASAELFTPESIARIKEYLIPIAETRRKIKELSDAYVDAQRADSAQNIAADSDKATQTQALKNLQDANKELSSLDEKLRTFLANFAGLKNITEPIRKSVADLPAYLGLSEGNLKALVATVEKAGKNAQTGKKAGINKNGSSTGDKTFDPKQSGAESLARRLARAEYELAKSQNEAISNLLEEKNRQQLAILEDGYRKGLVSLQDYYDRKRLIEEANIDTEITERYRDISEAQRQQRGSTDAAEKRRFDSEIVKLEGQIAVLQQRREGLRVETKRGLAEAEEAFNLNLLTEANKLRDQGLLPNDVVTSFSANLAQLQAEAKTRLQSLRTNGQTDLANAIEASLPLEATSRIISGIQAEADVTYGVLDGLRQRIQLAAGEGKLTTAEAQVQSDEAISNAVFALEEYIRRQEAAIQQQRVLGQDSGPAFGQLVNSVEQARLRIAGLKSEMNSIAKGINEGIRQSAVDTLANMEFTFNGIKEAARGLLVDIANQIRQTIAKDLVEGLFNNLQLAGKDGAGGIGGFVQGLLGGGAAKRDGSSIASALYTKDADSGLPGSNPNKPVVDAVGKVEDGTLAVEAGVGNMFQGLGASLQQSDNVFVQMIGVVLSTLGTLFATLITSLWTISTTEQASEGLQAGGASLFGFAHTGGVIGEDRLRTAMVSPAVFLGAPRYHKGGLIGLKPNEVPIIAEKGEEMITEDDPRHRKNIARTGEDSETGMGGVVNVWVVTKDQQPSAGPNDVVAVVEDNIARGGSIKRLIKQVSMGM